MREAGGSHTALVVTQRWVVASGKEKEGCCGSWGCVLP